MKRALVLIEFEVGVLPVRLAILERQERYWDVLFLALLNS
jgi:hypothetical protein